MAYSARYIFSFRDILDGDVLITIAEDGFSGTAIRRSVGGSPVLKCEDGGAIKGMSLEFPAECEVEDEFAILYTPDPYRFQVWVEIDGQRVWTGFVTPELYAAPWVDPPYDVTVTATDGLGELKRHTFHALGEQTLEAYLMTMLAATGLDLPLNLISTLETDVSEAPYMLSETAVNLDFLDGETYYDVVERILGSINATIRQRDGRWLIVRETDITALTDEGVIADSVGIGYPVRPFGSLRTSEIWPVGRLNMEIVPARNRVEVNAANKPREDLVDIAAMLGDGSWNGIDKCWELEQGEWQYADIEIPATDAANMCDLNVRATARQSSSKSQNSLYISVRAYGTDTATGQPGMRSLRVKTELDHDYISHSGIVKDAQKVFKRSLVWDTAEDNMIPLDTPLASSGTASDCGDMEVVVPLASLAASDLTAITRVRVMAGAWKDTIYLHGFEVSTVGAYESVGTVLALGNSARGAARALEPVFSDTFPGNLGRPFLANVVRARHGQSAYTVETFGSDAFPAQLPYGEWLAKDFALACATPRLRLQGRLQMPDAIPPLCLSTGGLTYMAESWTMDLIQREADISLISLPATSLQVVSVTQTAYTDGGAESTSVTTAFPSSFSIGADDTATRHIAVTAPTGMSWAVTGAPSWITVISGSGTGSGTASFRCDANSGERRAAVLSVAGVPVSVSQEGIGTEYRLEITRTPADSNMTLTVDGQTVDYAYGGIPVGAGLTVTVRITKDGYRTVTDSFTMPFGDTRKSYELTEDLPVTMSYPSVVSSAAQNVPITVSDPSGKGWAISFQMSHYYGYITGAGVTSGDAVVSGTTISGIGNAAVYLTVPANTGTASILVGGANDPIYVKYSSEGSYEPGMRFTHQGAGSSTVTVTSVTLNKNTLSLTAGNSETLAATVQPSNATNPTLSWTTTDSGVAAVDQSGKVTAIGAGTATIRASATDGSGKYAQCAVTVTAAVVRVDSVTLNRQTASIPAGTTLQLTADVQPSNATDKSVTWSSSDTSVATVSQSGLITGVAPGTATVTVRTTDNNRTATCVVTVTSQGTLSVENITVTAAQESASVTVESSNVDTSTIRAASSASFIRSVSVDVSGTYPTIRLTLYSNQATTQRTGTVNVTATDGNGDPVSTSFTVTQRAATSSDVPCTGVEVSGPSTIANSSNEATYNAVLSPSNTTQRGVSWSVSGPATIVPDGLQCLVRITGDGTVTVTATNTYNTARTGSKTVTADYIHNPGNITVSPSSVTLDPLGTSDDTAQVTATDIEPGSLSVKSYSGLITGASLSGGKLAVSFTANQSTVSSRSGSVTLRALDLNGDDVEAVVQYTQPAIPMPDTTFGIMGLHVEQQAGKISAAWKVRFRNQGNTTGTVYAPAWTLKGYDSGGSETISRSGTLPDRTVSANSEEWEIYSDLWNGVIGSTVEYVITMSSGLVESSYTGDGDDDLDNID